MSCRAVFFLLLWEVCLCIEFVDVTWTSNIQQPHLAHKWGGPHIADLNSDGIYDLILSHHSDAKLTIHYGRENGTYQTVEGFRHRKWDVHGIGVAGKSATSGNKLLAVAVGGGMGTNLAPPVVYEVDPKGAIRDVTNLYGFQKGKGRGRTPVWMDVALRKRQIRQKWGGGPDMVYFSYRGEKGSAVRQFGYMNRRNKFMRRRVRGVGCGGKGCTNVEGGIEWGRYGRVELTDIDGDGVMEIISMREFRIYKLVRAFVFRDVTERIMMGAKIGKMTVSAVAELDFDNDGDMDLYVARTDKRLISNRRGGNRQPIRDVLLENRNGRFVDVTERANLRWNGYSHGVSVGDIDNDGYVDVVLATYFGPDVVLRNNGNGTFTQVSLPKVGKGVGNNVVAFDYDGDGRVDVMTSQGERLGKRRGRYWLLRNITSRNNRHWLQVWVGNSNDGAYTALHAEVRVGKGKQTWLRRVGSVGAAGGGGSLMEIVHFGLGDTDVVDWVEVRWGGDRGVKQRRWGVKADQRIQMGVFWTA